MGTATSDDLSTTKPSVGLIPLIVGLAIINIGFQYGFYLASTSTAVHEFSGVNDIVLVAVLLATAMGLERLVEVWASMSFLPGFGGQKRKAAAAGNHARAMQIRENTKFLTFAIGAAYGMIFSGVSHLFLLDFAGVTGVPDWINVLSTGFAVAAVTEPLHKLFIYLERKLESV